MPKKNEGYRDGIKKLGPGKWLARITITDPTTKKKLVDTERTVKADTRLEALQRRAELRAAIEAESLQTTVGGWTVDNAFDAFLPTLRPGTLHTWGSHARKIRAAFGTRKLASIRPEEVQKFLADLTVGDTTARNVRTLFARLFVFARSQGEHVGSNPIREVEIRKTPKTNAQLLAELESPPRRAYLGDEVQRFLAALPDDLRPLMTIQLLLGCRFGEASALEWRDVNLDTGEVRIRQTQYYGEIGPVKNKRGPRWTGLGPNALALLRNHREEMARRQWPGWERWVFPRPLYLDDGPRSFDLWHYETVRSWTMRVQRELGIAVVSRTHAMRHTHITAQEVQQQLALDAATAAADQALHRAMVGHASEAQTQTYVEPRALPRVAKATKLEPLLLGSTRTSGDTSGEAGT